MSGLRRITILIVMACCGLSAEGKYGGGSGTPEDPYLIYDANHMQAIGADSNDWDKCFKLMADIDLSDFTGTSFNIIGYWVSWDDYNPFTGVFDGNSHTISNFSYTATGTGSVGLFRCVSEENAEIRNLGLIDPYVSAGEAVGSLVGFIEAGVISNCYIKGGSVTGDDFVGGLVGMSGFIEGDSEASPGTISNCFSSVSVTGDGFVGGLVGNNRCTITNCYSTGSTSGNYGIGGLSGYNGGYNSYGTTISNCYSSGCVSGNNVVGGLVGANWSYITIGGHVFYDSGWISNCYATSNVSGGGAVGGLVGGNADGAITNCYATGSVMGELSVGGLVGFMDFGGTISNSYWDIETSGEPNMCGNEHEDCNNLYGKTTVEMKQQSTFKDWDFVNVWGIGEKQTYPYLRRYSAGDINKDGIVNFKDFAFVALQWLEEYNAGNRAPEVVITYPEDGARLMVGGVPPQTLITAEAEDSDGTVVRVEFFDGEMKLGEDTDGNDGWSYLWTEYSLGWHTLTAVAWDEEELSGVSAPVTVEVWMPDPPPP